MGIDDAARFFVFDGVRKLAPKLDYCAGHAGIEIGRRATLIRQS